MSFDLRGHDLFKLHEVQCFKLKQVSDFSTRVRKLSDDLDRTILLLELYFNANCIGIGHYNEVIDKLLGELFGLRRDYNFF